MLYKPEIYIRVFSVLFVTLFISYIVIIENQPRLVKAAEVIIQ